MTTRELIAGICPEIPPWEITNMTSRLYRILTRCELVGCIRPVSRGGRCVWFLATGEKRRVTSEDPADMRSSADLSMSASLSRSPLPMGPEDPTEV